MKKFFIALTALLLMLLCACTPVKATPYSTELADKLVANGAFSEPLEPLDREMAEYIYRLDGSSSALTDLRCYRSAGATCEEVAVLIFSNEAAAKQATAELSDYVAEQVETSRTYRPAEVPKLEKAWVSQRDNTILLLVAANRTVAENLIE